VQNEGGSIEFRVAADKERETGRNYLVPFGGFIPHVFILDGGKVLWHGHPSPALERALVAIVNKTYNLAEEIRKDESRANRNEYQILARRGDAKAKELGAKLLTGATTNVSELSQLAYIIIADFHNTNRDFALARQALERADKASGGKATEVMFTQGMMLFEEGKQEEGIAKAKKAIEMTANTNEAAILTRYLDVMEVRAQTKGQNSDSSEKKLDAGGAAPPPNRAVSPVGTN
jgi:tetratricopeptide (TPR) repeat protein